MRRIRLNSPGHVLGHRTPFGIFLGAAHSFTAQGDSLHPLNFFLTGHCLKPYSPDSSDARARKVLRSLVQTLYLF